MNRLSKLLASFTVTLAFATAVPAVVSAAQPDIINNLCAGANLQAGTNCKTGGNNATEQINRIIKLVINTLSLIVGIVAVVMIIVGGMRYVTSGGSDTSVTGAKNTILYAVIGLIIVAMAQFIVRFILNKLN